MSIITAQKHCRRYAVPLIVFWVLFQGMLFCAALLNSVMLPDTSSASSMASEPLMKDMSVVTKTHINEHSGHSEPLLTHAMDHSGADMSQDNCCDKQDNYLTNGMNSTIAPLLLSFVIFLVVYLPGISSKWFNYLSEPPPRFNYPRNHLLNCTFLN